MIEIKLQFNSLDDAIHALSGIPRDTVKYISTTLASPVQSVPVTAAEKAEVLKPVKPKAEKAAPAPTTEAPAPAPAAPAPTAPTAQAPVAAAPAPSGSSIDYPTLQKAVFKLAQISPDVTRALAKSFGVETFKVLDSARWADALTAVNAKIEELTTEVA